MQDTPLTAALAGQPMSEQDVAMRLEELTTALRMAGLVDADTPANIRQQREAGAAVFNPLDGFAPMVQSVPQPDR
jgi:hypothetical protein